MIKKIDEEKSDSCVFMCANCYVLRFDFEQAGKAREAGEARQENYDGEKFKFMDGKQRN